MSGGVSTGKIIWEWDGTNAVLLSDSGVIRKPGSTLVYFGTEGKLALTMADGKVTGATAALKGQQQLATGSAASLAGKQTPRRQSLPARHSGRSKSSGSPTERRICTGVKCAQTDTVS